MSRYSVTEIGSMTKDGKAMTLREVCNELLAYEDFIDVVRDAFSDGVDAPDGCLIVPASTVNEMRKQIETLTPKTEAELLEERLKAADALHEYVCGIRSIERGSPLDSVLDEYADAKVAHMEVKS